MVYVLMREPNGKICGYARLLPTISSYLLREIFPDLLAGALSRNRRNLQHASPVSCRSKDRCRTQRNALIAVSPLGVERLLQRMIVHAHRACPPVIKDGKPIFACWIEIDEKTKNVLGIVFPTESDKNLYAKAALM